MMDNYNAIYLSLSNLLANTYSILYQTISDCCTNSSVEFFAVQLRQHPWNVFSYSGLPHRARVSDQLL